MTGICEAETELKFGFSLFDNGNCWCRVRNQGTELEVCRLTNIFIRQLVGQTDTLGLVFDRSTVYDCVFELLNNGLVNSVALGKVSKNSQWPPWRLKLTKSSTVEAFFLSTTGAE